MKTEQLDALRLKYPNSSPEEIEALHAQLYPPQMKVGVVRDGIRTFNDGSTAVHAERKGENPHPDTSLPNKALRLARKTAPKTSKKKK